jgi:hypothetical protein
MKFFYVNVISNMILSQMSDLEEFFYSNLFAVVFQVVPAPVASWTTGRQFQPVMVCTHTVFILRAPAATSFRPTL